MFFQMIEIQTKHEAYSSKILERTYCSEQIARNSDPRTINSNKTSHIIAYCVNNENSEMRFVIQCEKRWMKNRKIMATNLAYQHKEELGLG